jgi:hypothetical protein
VYRKHHETRSVVDLATEVPALLARMVAARHGAATEVPALPVSELGQETAGDREAEKDMTPKAYEVADQCRELGLAVGDVIFGREVHADGGWHYAELTLLWIGKTEAVFSERHRASYSPQWSAPVETAQWTLERRNWSKLP